MCNKKSNFILHHVFYWFMHILPILKNLVKLELSFNTIIPNFYQPCINWQYSEGRIKYALQYDRCTELEFWCPTNPTKITSWEHAVCPEQMYDPTGIVYHIDMTSNSEISACLCLPSVQHLLLPCSKIEMGKDYKIRPHSGPQGVQSEGELSNYCSIYMTGCFNTERTKKK